MCTCNQTNPCNQTPNICGQTPCTPTQDCSCPVRLNSSCVTFDGLDLECSGIESGLDLNQTLQLLDAYICTAIAEINNSINLVNVGTGLQIYAGIDAIGRRKIRSLITTGNLLTSAQNTDDITLGIDETELSQFVKDNQKTYTLDNIGTGAEIYKAPDDVVGDVRDFNLKTLKATTVGAGMSIVKDIDTTNPDELNFRFKSLHSTNISIVENPDGSLEITAPDQPAFTYLTAYYINSNYTPTEGAPSDGSIIRPFVTWDEARAKMIGVIGTDLDYLGRPVSVFYPKNRNVVFILQTNASTALNPTINTLTTFFEKDTILTYTGNDLYVFDSEVLYPLVPKDGLNEITDSIKLSIYGKGQIRRTTPGGYIRSIGAKRGASVTTDNPNSITIKINRDNEDRLSLREFSGYDSSIYEGDILAPNGIDLVGDAYVPPLSLKWTTLLNPTVPLVYSEGLNFNSFDYPILGEGTLYLETIVNTGLHAEDTIIGFNELIIEPYSDLISVVQGDTFVPGFPGVYEPKNAPAIFMKNINFFVKSLLYINNGTFSFYGWDTFFKIEGWFNLTGTINFDTNYYIKTFADLTDSSQTYFELNGKTNSANLRSGINYLINSNIVGDFQLRMPNTILENVTNLSENPSTNVIPITNGTLSSINRNPVISGILSYANDVAAAVVLPPNSLYFNTTNNALDIV